MSILVFVRNLCIFCLGMFYGYYRMGISVENWRWIGVLTVLIFTNIIILFKTGGIVIKEVEE